MLADADFRLVMIGVLSREGIREMMPANRIMEMPLPMPCSVICSPSHMTKEAAGGEGQHDHETGQEAGAR